ncbi:MAG: RES family NAD+ phosphorylase [Candidatus Aminicenantes bacterium]|nr:MAG: RES family NAD+ phosphorylase [Candidatus Aminicenantes bacterium]
MPSKPGKPKDHPSLPTDFNNRVLPIKKIKGPWRRFYWVDKEALYFNKTNVFRFNAPHGEFGVLYLGEDAYSAFIETYGWLTGERYITRKQLEQRHLALVSANRLLKVVDLSGKGLAMIGADARLCMGDEYQVSQIWSLALWKHPRRPEGILYRTRHDPGKKAVALFDRDEVKAALSVKDMGPLLDHDNVQLLAKIMRHYKFILIP